MAVAGLVVAGRTRSPFAVAVLAVTVLVLVARRTRRPLALLARLLRPLGGLGVAGVALLLDAVGGLLRGEEGGGLGPRLVLEIDVIALVGQFARGDLADRPLRLQGAQDAEIVFGVLEVVLGQNPVTRRTGVAGQLLVALVDGLGVAADLDVLGTLRVP